MHRVSLGSYFGRRAFTLIELLVVIAIIAVLSVVVIVTLNPSELLKQSRDSSRLSDLATINSGLSIYAEDVGSSMGIASTTYFDVPDPSATSTLGDQCQGLGMPALAGASYQCAPSSSIRKVDGTGWIPLNLSQISSGAPFGSLPVDPLNQTSSNLYYTYSGLGSLYEITAIMESSKYRSQIGSSSLISLYPGIAASGNNFSLSDLWNPSGLVGYWNFEEGAGTTAYDLSGNMNNGSWTASGPYYTSTSKVGSYGANYNGSAFVNLNNPASLQVTAAISVSEWVNPTNYVPFGRLIANYNGGVTNNGPFLISENATSSQNIFCSIGNPNPLGSATAPVGVFSPLGAWYHVVCTFDGSKLILYMNGVVQASSSISGSLSYSYGYPWFIGASGTSTAAVQNRFSGVIDEVRIYNRALSVAEVQALYNAQK